MTHNYTYNIQQTYWFGWHRSWFIGNIAFKWNGRASNPNAI